ncbi:BspA family leucine-rich repeat surface protein [Gardnerella swidsinskii]|uniref:BspA family leucine-rich repeat surface protein n=1 Tax=Gardnerella swidsinskii TaxID=2792979 RepID=UPI002A312660|nr:BspA family leucine-rich repeat surface protein [Gardnerella swidsinskii]
MVTSGETIETLSIEPPSGADKCAVSADHHGDEFGEIINGIKKLSPTEGSLGFYRGRVYAYGHLSKNGVGLFSGKNISNIDSINNFDISYVTDMSYLFKDSSLTDFSFLSGWDVSKVTNMQSMFEGCTGLEDISGLANWNVGSVANMKSMFEGCTFLDDISGLSGWAREASKDSAARNVSNVTDMSNMFEGCMSLKSLKGLEDWDVSKVRSMSGMFASIIKNQNQHDALNPVDGYAGEMAIDSVKPLSKWNVGNVMNMNRMFEGCASITDFTGLEGWDTKSVVAMIGMFEYCKGISSLGFLKKWTVKNVEYMMAMFALCDKIKNTEGLENWNVSNVTKMDDMFAGCSSLDSISGLSNWNTSGKSSTSKLTSTYRMFDNCSFLSDLQPLSGWNVGSVTDMHDMFNNCGSLTGLEPLSGWDVGSVKNMNSMFIGCNGLTSLESLSKWLNDKSSVTDMSSMFSGCNSLSDLKGLEKWNVSNVKNMSSMFSGCATDIYGSGDDPNPIGIKGLADISALSDWNVRSVTDMSSMFRDCTNLSNLKSLEKWNVGSVKNMSNMFSHEVSGSDFDKLTDISGLSKWNVSNVKDMSSMFAYCKKLTGAADLSKWNISKVTNLSSMFSNAGAESGDSLILDFSDKAFTKSDTPVYTDDEGKQRYFSVDSMFSGFKGTLIANNLQSSGFENNPEDDPIKSHFADGEIFSLDENGHSNNIVVTNNITILDTISNDDDLKKIAYYIPVKAKLMEPGDIKNDNMTCDCNRDSGGTTYTYYVPALYNSSNLEKKQDEKSQDYAYRIVKNSFASKLRYAIDSQSGKGTSTEEPGGDEPGGDEPGEGEGGDESGGDTDTGSRSATLKSRVKKLRSARKSRSVRDGDDEDENPEPEPDEKQGNTYKIMFKKSSEGGCTWTELGDGDGAVPVSNPKSPLVFFTTTYYLETFVKPVPLPHTGGQSAVMFTFLSIGLFSMFAVAGAFGRHGWVASVLSGSALAGFSKAFGGGALDIASGAKHCFAHPVVSGSMIKSAVSAATGFFARFRSDDSTFGKHTKQR